jgi:hypothetical protein
MNCNAKYIRKRSGKFCFSDTGGPGEQEVCYRFTGIPKARTRALNGFYNRFDSIILTKDSF